MSWSSFVRFNPKYFIINDILSSPFLISHCYYVKLQLILYIDLVLTSDFTQAIFLQEKCKLRSIQRFIHECLQGFICNGLKLDAI